MKTLRRLLLLSLTLAGLCAGSYAADAPAADADKINVVIEYFNSSKGPDQFSSNYNLTAKKGTTVLEAIKLAGLESRLTNSAILHVTPNPARKDNDDEEPAILNVAAVRAGKAKDIPLEKSPRGHDSFITISYDSFYFPGGSPGDFAAKLVECYGVDWKTVQIPPEMNNVHVPEFRVENEEDGPRNSAPAAVVALYNSIALRYPAMGQWAWEGNIYKPQIVMLSSGAYANPVTAPVLKVKALPLAGIPAKNWATLEKDIVTAQDIAVGYQQEVLHKSGVPNESNSTLSGRISIQDSSKILVIIGTPAYIEMAESVVSAYEKNQEKNPLTKP